MAETIALLAAVAVLSALSGACLALGLARMRGALVTERDIANAIRDGFNAALRGEGR